MYISQKQLSSIIYQEWLDVNKEKSKYQVKDRVPCSI